MSQESINLGIAMAVRPFVYLLVAVAILIPIRLAVIRWFPDGRLKRLLLLPVNKRKQGVGSSGGASDTSEGRSDLSRLP